jgi:O-antigen ligase
MAVILLSGERKAYVVAIVAMIIWTLPLNWRHALAAVIAAPFLWAAVSTSSTGYIDRQIASFADALAGDRSGEASLASLMDDSRPTTLSNAQREISNRRAIAMWEKKPVLGIGTNAFEMAVKRDTSLPPTFRMGIHGEFYRALYENGIVGLALYSALWIAAFAQIALAWPIAKAAGEPSLNKIKLLCVTMLLIYCALEASKGLTLAAICVLPYVVALPPRMARTAAYVPLVRTQYWNSPAWMR